MAAVLLAGLLVWLGKLFVSDSCHLTGSQALEVATYFLLLASAVIVLPYWFLTAHSRREGEWPHRHLRVSRRKDERALRKAWSQNAVVLGYDVHGKPWFWHDRTRVMQGIVLGMTGMGKTTLLANIITRTCFGSLVRPKISTAFL